MLTLDQIDALRSQSGRLLDPIIEFLLKDIATRISEAGQFTSTASYEIWRLQNLGISQERIQREIRKRLKISQREAKRLLTQTAETGYNFDISRFPTQNAIPFSENTSLQQLLDATIRQAEADLTNITNTMGFVGPDGRFRELTDAYRNACDFAFEKVITGAQDYNSAVRDATRELAKQGILTLDYASGRHRSVEAAVRGNIMGGLGLMAEQISQQNHDMLGCNGWEISAHAASAPDHEPIQGKQYSDAEYKRLNDSLIRRIGTLNCGHTASGIILGVNSPQYTPEELERFRRENEEGVTYDGKHYTLYEAKQRKRNFERAIRDRKHRILIDDALGDTERLQTDQIRLVRLREEYNRFCKGTGQRPEYERQEGAGFTWKEGREAERVTKAADQEKIRLEKQREEEYNQRRNAALNRIRSDEIPKTLNRGNQQKHIKDSPGYIPGRSYIYGNLETAQELVDTYHGKGEPQFNGKGEWNNKEIVSADHIIGVNVKMDTGEETETSRFVIHYGKKGTHVVPTKELKK